MEHYCIYHQNNLLRYRNSEHKRLKESPNIVLLLSSNPQRSCYKIGYL